MVNDDNECSRSAKENAATSLVNEEVTSLEAFLEEIKTLIKSGKRRFVMRKDIRGHDYIHHLSNLGLTTIEEAWKEILQLESKHYFQGPEEDYKYQSQGKVIWVFKKNINETVTYIKLKIDPSSQQCVCLSFHEDYP